MVICGKLRFEIINLIDVYFKFENPITQTEGVFFQSQNVSDNYNIPLSKTMNNHILPCHGQGPTLSFAT